LLSDSSGIGVLLFRYFIDLTSKSAVSTCVAVDFGEIAPQAVFA